MALPQNRHGELYRVFLCSVTRLCGMWVPGLHCGMVLATILRIRAIG